MNLRFNSRYAVNRISEDETFRAIEKNEKVIRQALKGELWNESMFGWFSVSESIPDAELARIKDAAAFVRKTAELMVVIGIGGSNRGAMAAVQALHRSIESPTELVFTGDTLSASKLNDVLEAIKNKSVVLNVIAKDFNTLEPGITFRVLRDAMIASYGGGYNKRIIVTGSRGPGQLYEMAQKYEYRFIDFPKSIGGRFSVLSAVGLFPMAVAGVDIDALIDAAAETEKHLKETQPQENPAVRYAVNRGLLFSKGFSIESLVFFEPDLIHFARWWTQLFAETEGKNQEAIFPSFFSYSEDLHAVGQYVQQGKRCIAETYLKMFYENNGVRIMASKNVEDGFGYLDGIPFDDLNRAVYTAALEAHSSDGVPCLEIDSTKISERSLGELFYFFMFAVYVSATLLGVNPFTQDGVESYKKNMYKLLGKKT